jgi:peroxiredoxin
MKIKYLLFILALLSTSFSIAQKKNTKKKKAVVKAELPAKPGQINSVIPEFKVRNVVDSSVFTNKNFEKGKRTIIMYFGPDCGHCSYFTKRMLDSMSIFENTQIMMVSSSEFAKVKKFYDDQKLSTVPFVTTCFDKDYFFVTNFGVRSFPSAYVYNTKGRMVKFYESEFSVKALMED